MRSVLGREGEFRVIARGRIERVVYWKVWGGRGSYCERAYLESCLLEGMGREGELLREGVLRELFIGRYGEGGGVPSYCERAY